MPSAAAAAPDSWITARTQQLQQNAAADRPDGGPVDRRGAPKTQWGATPFGSAPAPPRPQVPPFTTSRNSDSPGGRSSGHGSPLLSTGGQVQPTGALPFNPYSTVDRQRNMRSGPGAVAGGAAGYEPPPPATIAPLWTTRDQLQAKLPFAAPAQQPQQRQSSSKALSSGGGEAFPAGAAMTSQPQPPGRYTRRPSIGTVAAADFAHLHC